MFRVDASGCERANRYCDGISRRSFLQVGVAGMASVSLGGVLRAAQAGDPGASRATATAVILLGLDGASGVMS
jgi:hypothetical protein